MPWTIAKECRKRDKKASMSAKKKLGKPGLDTAG